MATCLGLEDLVGYLLDGGAKPDAKGGKYRNALQVASLKSQVDIVNALLGACANANVHGGLVGNPLQAACLAGSEEIVRLLLSAGANLTSMGYYPSALAAVVGSLNPNPDVVLLIL